MGFKLDDLITPKRPATAVTPVADFPSDHVEKPEVEAAQAVQATTTEPEKGAAIDTTGIAGNGGNGTFAEQLGAETTSTEGAGDIQKIDWTRPYSEIEQNALLRQMTPQDIARDYAKNGDGNWYVFMPWLKQFDPNKTVQQSIDDQKRAERNTKMEQWGNFLMHLGNFFGTTQGAPSQQIESAQELTDRQRKIRESTDALREKGYDQMMVNIFKERQAKQAQMQAEAEVRANEALAAYRGAQKNQEEALTPVKVKTEQERGNAAAAAAALSTSKKDTEDALRGKKGKLLDAQTNNANAGAADHNASIKVKGAQVEHIHTQTEGQRQKNANQKEADDFNTRYVNDPTFKKHVNDWARHNHLAVGDNEDGSGGTWANEKNRQQAAAYARAKMKHDRTPPSRRGNGGSKVPPSRRGGGSKVPPSRRK